MLHPVLEGLDSYVKGGGLQTRHQYFILSDDLPETTLDIAYEKRSHDRTDPVYPVVGLERGHDHIGPEGSCGIKTPAGIVHTPI